VIYLDYNASTPVDPRVLEAMLPVFEREFANASSSHAMGQAAAELVEEARERVGLLAGMRPRNVIFTSGATEAAALAIEGILATSARRRVLVGSTEHKAVLEAVARSAALRGTEIDTINVDRYGRIDVDQVSSLLNDDVSLVAIMIANNETGTVFDPSAVADLVHERGALLLCDATQAAGKIPLHLEAAGVDLALMSAHKVYGPKGVGALLAERSVQAQLSPLISGGGQEHGLRGGTLNTPGIVGFGHAAALATKELDHDAAHVSELIAQLRLRLEANLSGMSLNGDEEARLPNTANLRFNGADADAIMVAMPGVAVSSGSACQSAVPGPSHVLAAMGLGSDAASESIRFSVGRPTTGAEIDSAVGQIINAVSRVRALSDPEQG
jgi:cysteine desulfurase